MLSLKLAYGSFPFYSKLPLEHVPTVWPTRGIFFFEDHLQEKENMNKKMFRSNIYRKSYSKNFKILYTLTAIKIFNIFASEHYGKTYVILEQL
jgi:hypothetical protein